MQIDAKAVAVDALQNSAVTTDMHQSKWSTEKVNHNITKEVKDNHGAKGRAGKYKVNLANGFERDIQAITRIMSRAYHTHLRMTMPWGDGQRLLSNTRLIEYLGAMQKYKDELDAEKAKLLPKLPQCIARAIQLNNGICTPADYPSPQDIVDSYSFTFDFTPLPDASCFGSLPEGFETVFTEKYNSRVKTMMAAGVEDNCSRMLKLVGEFRVVLGRDKPKFFQSTLDNISELTKTLRYAADLTGDGQLSALCDRADEMVQYTAEQLRSNMSARLATTSHADQLLAALNVQLNLDQSAHSEPAPLVAPPEPTAPSSLDELLGPDDETPSDLAAEIADSMNDESRGEAEQLLGDIMPELTQPVSTVETETPAEPASKQSQRDMIAEVANMEVPDEDDDLASLFDGLL